MISLRISCTGRRPVHFFRQAVAGVLLAAMPLVASPASAAPATVVGMATADFYNSRKGAPFWFAPNAGYASQALIALLKSSKVDGMDPDRYGTAALEQAVAEAASGKRKSIDRADVMLSQAFASYVSDLRQLPDLGIVYVDPQLKPAVPTARAVLVQAAAAPSLENYVRTMGWMNPIYGELREALTTNHYASDHERELLELNLERARTLPAGKGRYVMVNAAEQRLYMYDDRKPVDSMVVVVGKPKYPTPLMAAFIRFAALNPYWYVPPDLASERIAPNVVKRGQKYLDELGYEVMSDWTKSAAIVDPKTVDWKGVAAGKVEVMMRQKPGPHNSMGRVKFMFPNDQGVYLHDNPERELFTEASRLYSGGCVRLEDAWRLGRWLFGRDLTWEGAGTEEPVALTPPVPVYITYLTAMPDGTSIAYYDDVYGRDAPKLAGASADSSNSAVAGR